MLRKRLLSITTDWLARKNKYIIDATCYSTLSTNSYMDSEQDNIDIKNLSKTLQKEIEKIKSQIPKSKRKFEDEETFNFIRDMYDIDPEAISVFPKAIMKIYTNKSNVSYLVDTQVAKEYVSLIKDDLLKNQCFVAEMNPGFGILTKELLKAGVQLIHLYEANSMLHMLLNKLHAANPGRLDLRNVNLLTFPQLSYIDKETDGNRIENILQGVKATDKWENQCMQVIGSLPANSNFLRHITFSLLFRHSLMHKGRIVFYVMVPPSLWHSYTCDTSDHHLYITQKVLFQAMFDYKLLGKFKRKAFLPWLKEKKVKTKKLRQKYQIDSEKIFLAKIEPKVNMYSIFSKEDWIIFWYFVRHNMNKRCNRVIPNMEKWVPGCGEKLIIRFNYTIFTQFGNLTPNDFIELFKEFQSWPEYKTSTFISSIKTSQESFNDLLTLELNKE